MAGKASALVHPFDGTGTALDASFRVDSDERGLSLYFASGGGAAGSKSARNTQYSAGLALLLERLQTVRASIDDAVLDSTRVQERTLDERRLPLSSPFALPIRLAGVHDFERLRLAIQAAQPGILRTPGDHQSGGNSIRAIRLFISLPAPGLHAPRLQAFLSTGLLIGYPKADEAEEEVAKTKETGPYTPTGEDSRERARRSILLRRGQGAFRRSLVRRYGGRCCVTGCDLADLLEGAHIDPYRGTHTNHPENGLLLRADIHTLFDLDLLGIDPDAGTVHLHPAAARAGYAELDGVPFLVAPALRPSAEAMQVRWGLFLARLSSRGDVPAADR